MRIAAANTTEFGKVLSVCVWDAGGEPNRNTGRIGIFVNFGATSEASKANKGLPIGIMHRDSDATEDPIVTASKAALTTALDTRKLLDMLIAVGGYRAVSMAINSAGVQLDPNMATFRFPPSLR
jgi:hypothetical protein